jgi:succinoglycan biosynthesis protein ExoO
MNGTPTISVTMAARNAEELLPRTLRSIQEQTFADFELIVVDDGSTDATGEVVAAFAREDPRITLVTLPENLGRSRARNVAIDTARGEWICPTDADDLWASTRLASMLAAAEQFPGAVAVTDHLIGFTADAGGEVAVGARQTFRGAVGVGTPFVVDRRRWFADRECHMTPIVRRSHIDAHSIRYVEEASAGEDLNFYVRIAFAEPTTVVAHTGEISYYYRQGESTRAANMAESRAKLMQLAVESTQSVELEELVGRENPGWIAIYQRADRIWADAGRAADRDEGLDGVSLSGNRLAGLRTLLRNRIVSMVAHQLDRQERARVLADLQRQLQSPIAEPMSGAESSTA